MKPFPIPVLALGPGAHSEDDALDYLPMPKDMGGYQTPILPEPDEIQPNAAVRELMAQVLQQLQRCAQGQPGAQVPMTGLAPEDLGLIDQLLGEGEASALIAADASGTEVRIQESIFTGVWRVLLRREQRVLQEWIEVAAVPQGLLQAALDDAQSPCPPWVGSPPPNVQNAPLLVQEVRERVQRWQPGDPVHVINLTLLPVTPADIGFLDHQIGTGRVLLLSRGYGNCRITNTRLPNCWRVVYYNSNDRVILNTVEIIGIPEVALAAAEDMASSHERLLDVLQYLELA